MTLNSKNKVYFRQKIVSYYEELISTIDLKTEELLASKSFAENQIEVINDRRNEWIQRIQLVRDQNIFNLEQNMNLETLNLLINDEEQLNSVLFQNGFLIFTKHNPHLGKTYLRYNDDDREYNALFIGRLIFKTGYLNKNVIKLFE